MKSNSPSTFKKKILPAVLGGALALAAAGCMGPTIAPATPDSGWNTSYPDALSPHTQLALGVLKALKENPAAVPAGSRADVAQRWQKLAGLVESKASAADLNAARRDVESALGDALVSKIKSDKPTSGDLMAFMMSSGMKIPAGGIGSLNPDHVAATKAVEALSGAATVAKAAPFEIKAVDPEEALSPTESLVLGTVLLLRDERNSFEMPQVFRLALYIRPLRRVYDPNPDLVKNNDPRIEAVYMDRIWRTLKPEQVKRIREMNLTRKDMIEFVSKYPPLHNLDWKKNPTFALLEDTVNDFHEQIAPANTIKAKDKPDFYVAPSLKQTHTGKNPGDGQALYEGICSSCHGMDGQGRFPPIVMMPYLGLHSDHEHHEIIKAGPPQLPTAPIVMPTFGDKLTNDQVWAIVKYVRSWEKKWGNGTAARRGEGEAKTAGVKFLSAPEVYEKWKAKSGNVVFLDLQSDIAYRIMGHIPGSLHIRPEDLDQRMKEIPKDKEIVVIDMFATEGLVPAQELSKLGYKITYMSTGMEDWHIERNYPVAYN